MQLLNNHYILKPFNYHNNAGMFANFGRLAEQARKVRRHLTAISGQDKISCLYYSRLCNC